MTTKKETYFFDEEKTEKTVSSKLERKFSISDWEKVGNLKVMTLLNVSSRGNSLCIIVPRDVVDVHGVISGDRVRVWFLDHYRKKRSE
jgi:hypothetical protein